ncbi:MAG: DUF2442 domain-containing protein [Bacteroidetes bacterium]|nr:MAG: DUF2442 domain-containing protein [Bacteroidota bacterium]
MIEIKNAKYIDNYKIWLEFSDGTSGIADLSEDLWGKIFEPLKDKNYFKNFAVSETMRTISWDNGADLSPEYLYDKVKNKN